MEMNMTTTIRTAALAVAMFGSVANGATIDEIIVRQQWPWSTDVRVEYRVTGVTDPVDISVAAYDGDTPLDASRLASSMKGDLFGIAKAGYYSFTIDPVVAFGTSEIAVMNFNVRLSTTASAANMTDVLYKVVDLDSGAVTDVTRADFYGNKYGNFVTNYTAIGADFTTSLQDVLIWTEVTNNPIYKTDKLVMRRIPASSWGSWTIGAGGNGNSSPPSLNGGEHLVSLSADYYIGVFPVTQAQCKKIWGTYGMYYTNVEEYADHKFKPATGIEWWNLRSLSSRTDAMNDDPEAASFCGIVNAKSGIATAGLKFDLPTEAQWEFAARGGVMDKDLYSGATWGAGAIHTLAWNRENILSSATVTSGNAGYDQEQTVAVGRKPPNAFGLYDTLGNAYEYCRDYTDDAVYSYSETPCEDPKGVARESAAIGSGSYKKHVARGGAVDKARTYCGLCCRFSFHENEQPANGGFRLICTVAE